jgi:hypothetical protein
MSSAGRQKNQRFGCPRGLYGGKENRAGFGCVTREDVFTLTEVAAGGSFFHILFTDFYKEANPASSKRFSEVFAGGIREIQECAGPFPAKQHDTNRRPGPAEINQGYPEAHMVREIRK